MSIGDRVVVLATEERGELVDITRDGRLRVRLDPGPGFVLATFDPFEVDYCGV